MKEPRKRVGRPLAADFVAWSPYNYVMGNPIMMIDPDGKEPTIAGDPIRLHNSNVHATATRINENTTHVVMTRTSQTKREYMQNGNIYTSILNTTSIETMTLNDAGVIVENSYNAASHDNKTSYVNGTEVSSSTLSNTNTDFALADPVMKKTQNVMKGIHSQSQNKNQKNKPDFSPINIVGVGNNPTDGSGLLKAQLSISRMPTRNPVTSAITGALSVINSYTSGYSFNSTTLLLNENFQLGTRHDQDSGTPKSSGALVDENILKVLD